MDQGTDEFEDILMTIKNKKWTWGGHVMRRLDDRWITRATELQSRNSWRIQGSKVIWRDEIRAFAGPSWTSATSEREREREREAENVGKGLCPAVDLQWLNMIMMMMMM